jgi:hypothetical protein
MKFITTSHWSTLCILLTATGCALSLPAAAQAANCPLNVSLSAKPSLAVDGLLLSRYAQRVRGQPLYNGIKANADLSGVEAFIASNTARLDVDGDGALTTADALIIARYLAGYSRDSWLDGLTLPIAAQRRTGADIDDYIGSGCPAATQGAPATPDKFGAAAGAAQVVLTWQAVAGASAYTVKRATLPATYVDASLLAYAPIGDSATAAYNDVTATVGVDYIYTVTAKNSAGESANSRLSCSAAKPAGTITSGKRPRVYLSVHGSQPLSGGTPQQDAQWAYVRMCLDGLYNNRANVSIADQAAIWRKLSTRNVFGIYNLNGQADNPDLAIDAPGRFGVENAYPDIRIKRDATVVYSTNPNLWTNTTIPSLRATLTAYPNANPNVTPEVVWKGVYAGYALRDWINPTVAPDGAISNPGAVNAVDSADGTMVECIGGLCGSNGMFGTAITNLFQRTRANDKPFFMFASKNGTLPISLGWLEQFQSGYNKITTLGGWRADDVIMVIPYQGTYPVLPMTHADGSTPDTVTGMLHWALHQ